MVGVRDFEVPTVANFHPSQLANEDQQLRQLETCKYSLINSGQPIAESLRGDKSNYVRNKCLVEALSVSRVLRLIW